VDKIAKKQSERVRFLLIRHSKCPLGSDKGVNVLINIDHRLRLK